MKNEDCGMLEVVLSRKDKGTGVLSKSEETVSRLLDFAANCARVVTRICGTMAGRYYAQQLLRSSASAGANYQEACAAESRPDFIHKMHIVLKELRESEFWLKLISRLGLLPPDELAPFLSEADQLIRISASSVLTAKSRKPQ